jgi:hypothetical protein
MLERIMIGGKLTRLASLTCCIYKIELATIPLESRHMERISFRLFDVIIAGLTINAIGLGNALK